MSDEHQLAIDSRQSDLVLKRSELAASIRSTWSPQQRLARRREAIRRQQELARRILNHRGTSAA